MTLKLERNYPDDVVEESWKQLKDLKVNKNTNSTAGHKALDKFFYKYRIKTKSGKWSHYTAWNDKGERPKIIESWRKLYPNSAKMILPELVGTLQMRYGSINQFRPSIAKFIYSKYKPKKVLDFSAGWGGRLLGAMSLGVDYIGIDSNKKLSVPYRQLINKFSKDTDSNIKMIFKPAENVDVSNMDYDMVFTSPPYGTLEKYEGMKDYKDFNEDFLFPVIEKTYKNLKQGGYYILNIPVDIYNEVKKILGKPINKIELVKNYRTGSGNKYKEYIYVWKK
tara:strand:+ start:62 stop:898 length:837 start_codon:yes stop_codon:yes gene_type:complete